MDDRRLYALARLRPLHTRADALRMRFLDHVMDGDGGGARRCARALANLHRRLCRLYRRLGGDGPGPEPPLTFDQVEAE